MNVHIGQTVRHHRESYLNAVRHGERGGWDVIALTAGTERQAAHYRLEIDQRRRHGLLPQFTEFVVLPDPPDARVGSGGSTLLALGELARRGTGCAAAADYFRRRKILILHSGGESRRLPMLSGIGKLFARVPLSFGNGVSTLFDEFLASLNEAPRQFREGVVVASGDVMLLFDNMQLQFNTGGVVGVSMPAAPETACRHGVYLADARGRVRRFLHKVSPSALQEAGAVENGTAQIDTGIVWFDVSTIARFVEAAGLAPDAPVCRETLRFMEQPRQLSLYADLLGVLAVETRRRDYIEGVADDGCPPSPELMRARRILWERLRGTPFHVNRLPDATFIHFGTAAEYSRALIEGTRPDSSLRWQRRTAALAPHAINAANDAVWLNSVCRGSADVPGSVIADSVLGAGICAAGCLVSRVFAADTRLDLPPETVLFQVPVRRAGVNAIATFVMGIHDNPKTPVSAGATFLNRPWREQDICCGASSERIWPACLPPDQRSLWHAACFPVCADREHSLRYALAMARRLASDNPAPASREVCPEEIVSMDDALAGFDSREAIAWARELEDHIAAGRFSRLIGQGRPVATAIREVDAGAGVEDIDRRLALAINVADERDTALNALRIRYCAGEALAQCGNAAAYPDLWQRACRYRDRAFDQLAELIRRNAPRSPAGAWRPKRDITAIRAAARLDFGGGWSDTPPYSLYSGGTVLNAAVRLNAALPIAVTVERLDRPVIELASRDLDAEFETGRTDPILDYRDPSDTFALHKAALVLCGVVPEESAPVGDLFEDGTGLRLTTDIAVPKGSGLGTSSILAGALLCALYRAGGRERSGTDLMEDVFSLEQMLTTGGGWQDQVGGLMPGIKLTVSSPGIQQRLQISSVTLPSAVSDELDRRLLLIYTGRRRLAKGILRAIMGRYLSNDPVVRRTLSEIQALARAMLDALMAGDFDLLGNLMSRHWEMNRRMDAGSTTPGIDALFEAVAPYVTGAKLAGAGGGGFVMAVARDDEGTQRCIQRLLQSDFPEASIWNCRITTQSLQTDGANSDIQSCIMKA